MLKSILSWLDKLIYRKNIKLVLTFFPRPSVTDFDGLILVHTWVLHIWLIFDTFNCITPQWSTYSLCCTFYQFNDHKRRIRTQSGHCTISDHLPHLHHPHPSVPLPPPPPSPVNVRVPPITYPKTQYTAAPDPSQSELFG